MTDAEKKPCCAAEPAEKDTAPSCCRHKDRTPEEYRALANRLSRIEGYAGPAALGKGAVLLRGTVFRASYKRERNLQWNNTMSRA